jgi:hypothetical protein
MNPMSEDIKDKLVAAGLGTFAATTGWGIFINSEPDSPNTTITIYDGPGPEPDEVMDSSQKPLLHPTVQVRVRDTTYLAARTKMDAVVTALRRLAPWTVGADCRYLNVFQSSEPLFLLKDQKDRFVWVVDFRATRKAV